ncbi:MAG TPA: circadian clock KaiB family protein [Vicinamibacterales bacterium]|nr:circadian clock KaiB family protein [Vicinamibacterales bacterium]
MYAEQTQPSHTVQVNNGLAGRILVVDDDRAFGGFMLASLSSRGHDVEWAGCILDALGNLYSERYDLVIIDLRLPDGNGLELLRQATEEGLLTQSAAIILTGHDFDEPDDIRVFHKPLDIESFLDRMGEIIAHTKKREVARSTRPPAHARGTSHDRGRRSDKQAKIELVLYVSPSSEKCQKAVRTIQQVLEQYDAQQVNFSVCDLTGRPSTAEEDAVVFTPTLVKRGPGPRTWIVGNLDQPELLVDLLEVSGVDRKKD